MLHFVLMTFALAYSASAQTEFHGQYFSGLTTTSNGSEFLGLLDKARRMFSSADLELQTLRCFETSVTLLVLVYFALSDLLPVPGSMVYDPVNNAVVEGSQWAGNQWTQNSYGLGVSSTPFLQSPYITWCVSRLFSSLPCFKPLSCRLQTSYLWWFDHMGDGTELSDKVWAPDGINLNPIRVRVRVRVQNSPVKTVKCDTWS